MVSCHILSGLWGFRRIRLGGERITHSSTSAGRLHEFFLARRALLWAPQIPAWVFSGTEGRPHRVTPTGEQTVEEHEAEEARTKQRRDRMELTGGRAALLLISTTVLMQLL